MRLLSVKGSKSTIADDGFSCEVLEFGRVRTCVCSQMDQMLGTLDVAIMIGGNIRNKICGIVTSDLLVIYFQTMVSRYFAHATVLTMWRKLGLDSSNCS